jgi:hypothetical protein
MAKSGITRIDALLGAGAPALQPGDSDSAAVGMVQELLRSHGYTRLPDMRSDSYGRFGDLTRQSVLAYRAAAGLEEVPRVDKAMLDDLAARNPRNPMAVRGYLTLALDMEYNGLLNIVALTTLFESGARFACLNLNTDRCGLSFGIIQWAQKPGRLHEILEAFHKDAPETFAAIAVDPGGLLAHTARPRGGVDAGTGETVDPAFDLISDPWRSRFEELGRNRDLQKTQVRAALAAFQASTAHIAREMPALTSQRSLAFTLDLANQHGDGGAAAIYQGVFRPGIAEPALLAAMERESVRRVAAQYGERSDEAASTANRRRFFRTTPWLSEAATAVA